ncbi:MAG: caspase family protein [Clostridia bacterium]|nr:caspase family protein [Clostridia bacterium]
MRKQIALCIGNDNYQYACLSKLDCATNDCREISNKLKNLNFDVLCYENLDRIAMHTAIDEFEARLPDYDVALFYYAGHGFECNGHNLLMPVDTNGIDAGYREWMALDLDYLISALEGKNYENSLKTKIIILDACRQDGAGRGGPTHGFAPVFAPEGTIIAFSTSPGQKAVEFEGHGAYTAALLQSIDLPRIPIENMFKHVREVLSAQTSGRQISWEHTSLMGNYCFNEDSIDAFAFYSSEALADKNYYFRTDNPLYEIIETLKSHDWYQQNPAITKLSSVPFESVSANDLFILGRNIFQAADGGAWSAQSYIKDFISNSLNIDIKKHILSGIAFEMYFDRNGLLRQTFKDANYIEILRLLENEDFQMCKNFIVAKLSEESNRIIYIPGSENKIELHLNCTEIEVHDNGDILYSVVAIYNQGANIIFSADGLSLIDQEWYANAVPFASLRVELAKKLLAPPDMVIITSNIEDKGNHYFSMPFNYSFRRGMLIDT